MVRQSGHVDLMLTLHHIGVSFQAAPTFLRKVLSMTSCSRRLAVCQVHIPKRPFSGAPAASSSIDFNQLGDASFVERMKQNLIDRNSVADLDTMVTLLTSLHEVPSFVF